ncbi:sentrin-specific protease 2 [Elysia marginata]|uniref:Sentrin-specific protease 2 n=1 Tax=Elysia marginata TaxID=1093978 RepID=A0AAV4EYT7_9GAST|nr:sentrin-specific protease 2 [Elysia marginata]
MASVLLRAGVPLLRVQEFISHTCHKDPTIKDLQNLKSSISKTSGACDRVKTDEYDYLNDVDTLMASDLEAVVEIINFDLIPGAIYIQTSSMKNSLKSVGCGFLQVITHSINDGKVFVVSVIGVDTNEEPLVLALCIILAHFDTTLRYFFEAFVRTNSKFCDGINGIILDCDKQNAEFLQQLIPQAYLAWSQSYITDAFANLASSGMENVIESLLEAETEAAYEQNIKCLMSSMKVSDCKEFLNTLDACKELWALHEMSSFPYLRLHREAIEIHYLRILKMFLKSPMSLSELIRALLRFVRNEDPGDCEEMKSDSFEVDPSCRFYRELCFHDAYVAIQCQIAVALNSAYEINQQMDMIFIKRKDSEEEYILNLSGTNCTCPYFLKEDLPCQHIFAWRKSLGKSLYDESLIPVKWQVFGSAVTLDAIAESLAQGHVPSSLEHDERIKELQSILKDLLASSCAHSYQQMGRDMALLRQVLVLMRTRSTYDASVVTKSDGPPQNVDQETTETSNILNCPARKPGRPPRKRGRGRPSNKEKLLKMMQEEEAAQVIPPDFPEAKRSKLEPLPTSYGSAIAPRHNLRKNIKHKFVTSDASSRVASAEACDTHEVCDENEDSMSRNIASVMQVEEDDRKVVTSIMNSDRTEIQRAVVPKALFVSGNSTSGTTGDKQLTQMSSSLHQKQALTRKPDETQRSREEDSNDVDYEDSCSDSEEETDDDSGFQETTEERRERRKGELTVFMSECSLEFLNEILQTVSVMDFSEQREDKENAVDTELTAEHPSEVIINSCEEPVEVDFVSSYISSLCPGFDQYTYQVASCLFCKANSLGIPILSMLQSLNPWPNHLPEFPSSRPFEGEVTLSPGQTLTLCGHKLDQDDMDSLRAGKEITSETVHAYLEILAQKHSGKMFVLPFSVVHIWRNGSYTDMLFKKVHFKTFDFLVLPILCGGEFTQSERESVDMLQPCWMALVADVKAKTVSMLNPRTEDRFTIAANGYMLQWRRYMQVRSVHTREMLSAWTTKPIDCNKTHKEGLSAIMLLMNIEALICGVPPMVMHPMIHSSRYRHHIAACLRDTDWQTTVLCVGGPECQRMAARDADWVQCENCRAWWHRACATAGTDEMGDTENSEKAGIFYCTSCRQRIQALRSAAAAVGGGGVQVDLREEGDENVQEEDNQEEDEGEEEFEEEEEVEEVREDSEGTMKISEIPEEDEVEDGDVNLILGTAAEIEAEVK